MMVMVAFKVKRAISRIISELHYFSRIIFKSKHGLRILFYHSVGSSLENDPYGIFSISQGKYEEQVKFLGKYYRSYFKRLNGDFIINSNNLNMSVTFDDGYKNCLYAAAPILIKYQIPFTVFITTSFVKSGNSIYLNPDDLCKLSKLPGVTIGSHGITHAPLTTLDDNKMRNEIISSKAYLEDLLGIEIAAISYPHGSVNRRVRDAVEEAGYTLGVCSRFDINNESSDHLLLCRTEVTGRDSLRVFMQKLRGDWDWLRWRKRDPLRW